MLEGCIAIANLIGQSLGRYHILEQLGEGGMATVYKAYDTRLEADVAVKVIRTEKLTLESVNKTLKRFEREAKALAKLTHPNIVKVLDFGEYEGRPFLVMPYLPGGTLKQRLGKSMPWQEAAKLLIPIARALEYAHSQGILHRDIKPSNILITATGQPMLSDFGVAKMLETEETMDLTGTGMGVGTPDYMAPEQGMGRPVDQRADVYALGIVLYELVTGRKPFRADTPMAIMLKKATEPMPRPRKFVADLPKRTEQVLLKALEKDPAQRFRDMAAFADELESLLAGQAAAPRPVKEPKRRPAPALHATRDQVERPDVLEKRPLEELKPRSAVNLVWVFGAGVIGLIILGVAASLLAGKPSGLFTMRTPTHTRTLAVTRTSTRTPTHTRTLAVTRTYTPTFGIGSTWVRPADGMVMVYVPAGEFNMGSNDGSPDQQPVHTVFLDALWIDRTEVTNAMYALCVQAGVCNPPDSSSSFDRISYYGNPQFDDYPVIHVSWQDAYSYCQWTDVRLPTEAEWEKAARGTDGRIYPWGNSSPSCSLANYSGCVGNTSAVGSYPAGASPYGALDMAGNVWEWVNDWYGETYYNQSVGASNPQGPANGNFRVFRGGAWYDIKGYVSASYRFGSNPALSDRPLGFRCSRPLP